MTGKTNKNPKMEVLRIPLVDLINMEHKLVLLSGRIDWESVKKDFFRILS